MYCATTFDIRITATPAFRPRAQRTGDGPLFLDLYDRDRQPGRHPGAIARTVWRITDANGRVETVRGPGVVGETPIIEPGDSFSYTSGCALNTASGLMSGSYRMVDANGRAFDVEIPAFSLDSPMERRILN